MLCAYRERTLNLQNHCGTAHAFTSFCVLLAQHLHLDEPHLQFIIPDEPLLPHLHSTHTG